MRHENPRPGLSKGFHVYPTASSQSTLALPETVVWSSIRHLCVEDVAEEVAASHHNVKSKRDLEAIAQNLKIYIQHAYDFFDVAKSAKPNTAPLFYYYSFMNLAKAMCEIRNPDFHKHNACYRHGISWNPNRNYCVDLKSELVSINRRGVWHALWEALSQDPCPAANPTKLEIKDLFLRCPEISVEAQKAFGVESHLIRMVRPEIIFDPEQLDSWIKFSVLRTDLKDKRISANSLNDAIKTPRSGYMEVQPPQSNLRTFESIVPLAVSDETAINGLLWSDIQKINPFCSLAADTGLHYSLPIPGRLPLVMPQLMVLYTLIFWLGSLVRYDPHSVDYLMDSKYWTLLDGFMSQSILWLLELFEWAFFQTETTLRSVR